MAQGMIERKEFIMLKKRVISTILSVALACSMMVAGSVAAIAKTPREKALVSGLFPSWLYKKEGETYEPAITGTGGKNRL